MKIAHQKLTFIKKLIKTSIFSKNSSLQVAADSEFSCKLLSLDSCRSSEHASNRGFSLIEVLVVAALVLVLLIVSYFFYLERLGKARDGRRKSDLRELTVIMEDFFNDHGCYPRPTEVCYDAFAAGDDTMNPCYICGEEADPMDNFKLPCNPEHPQRKYLYEVEDVTCPQWYRVYTELAVIEDNEVCPHGLCGPDGGYDYGVSSPNVDLGMKEDNLIGYTTNPNNDCGNCGTLAQCEADSNVEDIYPTEELCCDVHPNADSCTHWGWIDDGGDGTCSVCHGSSAECLPGSFDQFFPNKTICCNAHPSANGCP